MGNIIRALRKNKLLDTFFTVRGNQRACLWTEPLWGIPYNLYVPFVSVYMAALGMNAVQIGVVSTVFFASQMVFALLSGPLTDKLGRRVCTVIFDCLSWSVPALIWMCAQGYAWFLVAAVFNGAWRVTESSWGLLLIEDAPEDKLVNMYSISHVAGLLAGFVAPLAYFFVRGYGVVSTMRVLYGITFVMMTTKFVLLFFISRETSVGKRRMAECRGQSIFSRLWDSRHVLSRMLKNPQTLRVVGALACFAAMKNISDNFWPLLVRDRLGIAEENLSVFFTVKSLMMLVVYFTIVPRISIRRFKRPLIVCMLLMGAVQALMICLRQGAYAAVILGVAMEALALSVLNPLMSSLQAVSMDTEERARMLGLSYAVCMLVTSPFGTLAGYLSEINRALPMGMNLALVAACVLLVFRVKEE